MADIQQLLAGLGVDAGGLTGDGAFSPQLRFASTGDLAGSRRVRAPETLTATTALEDRVTLAWADRSAIERDYEVRAIYSATDSVTVQVGPNRTGWTDVAVPAGADVTYRVRAIDRDPASNSASVWVRVVGRRTLLPPGQVAARQDVREMELRVTWRDSSRAEMGYLVTAVSALSSRSFLTAANVREVAVPIAPPEFGQTVTLIVRALGSSARPGAPSQSAVGTTTATPTLLAPRVVTASSGYTNQVVVSWTDDSGANTGYRVVRDGTVLATLGNATTFTDAAPTGPATYCVTPTGAAGAVAEPAPACATGRTSTVSVVNTGDVVGSPVVASGLDAPTGSAGFGRSVAAASGRAAVGGPNDALLINRLLSPDWATPWNDATRATGGYAAPAVRADVGMASVFERTAAGWDAAARIQLARGDALTYTRLGASVDVSGDYALVGAPGSTTYHNHPTVPACVFGQPYDISQFSFTYGDGGAYLYGRAGDGRWLREGRVLRGAGRPDLPFIDTAPPSAASVPTSFSGTRYQCSQGGDFSTSPTGGVLNTMFTNTGEHVALTPSRAFVSTVQAGAFMVSYYLRSSELAFEGALAMPANPGAMTAASQLVDRSLDATDEFLVIGSGRVVEAIDGVTFVGRVQVHFTTPTEVSFSRQILRPPVGGAAGSYGAAVSIRGDLLLVGAPGPRGTVYVHRRSTSTGWLLVEATLIPQNGDTMFGASVSVSDGFVAVSATAASGEGVVYTFRQQGTAWVQAARLAQEDPAAAALFGRAVASSADDLVIGAPGATTASVQTGAVYFATVGVTPSAVAASDGIYNNRVQVRWNDEAASEDGYRIYRRGPANDAHVLVGTVAPNLEVFDDFDVNPGDAYSYCVASFLGDDETDTNPLGESGRVCDIGYTPANGTISGRLATSEGGPVVGSPVCLAPGPDQAINFDGLGGRATVPEFGAIPASFTMGAWFNADAFAGAQAGLRSVAGVEGNGYALLRVLEAGSRPQVAIRLANGTEANITSGTALTPGVWYHIAATVDDVQRRLTLYINGAASGSVAIAAPVQATGSFVIGQWSGQRPFDGRIDDVRLWARARTAAEIAADYAARLPLRGDEPGLAAYWAMDQGTGRILTDLTAGGRHAALEGGAEWTRESAPMTTCATSDGDGNYTFSGLRYGTGTAFRATPADPTRQFTPAVQTATLTRESPTENQLNFIDTSAYTVRGQVVHALSPTAWPGQAPLPAPGIEILVDGVVAGRSEADGTFALAVRGAEAHTFEARSESLPGLAFTAALGAQTFPTGTATLTTLGDVDGLQFTNTATRELRGRAAGGCDRPLGDVTFRVYTEDRRFDRTVTTSGSAPYALPLAPLAYRLEFVGIGAVPGTLDRAAVIDYFRNLGVLAADLAAAADTVDFRYRAPITLRVEGLPAPAPGCAASGYTVRDADGVPRQTIPNVPVIPEYDRPELTLRAFEDYGGGQLCPVDEGTVRVFDGFADAAGTPVEVALANGVARYTSFARSPDTFAGRTVGGVDRSYQKSLTAVLEVPDGPSTTETVWAIVEGYREKPATFVTATMSEIPVLILRDPPGTESSAFIEEGTTVCKTLSNINTTGAAGGLELDFELGLKTINGFGVSIGLGAGVALRSTTLLGGGVTQTGGDRNSNMQICATTTERWETRGDTGWSGEDLYAGVGLNLLFAEADVVAADAAACTVNLSTALATDLDASDPFETTFVYGTTHITNTLIPNLEALARLAGEGTVVEGEVGPAPVAVTLRQAINNWHGMVAFNDSLVTEALAGDVENRSFSAGTTYSFGTVADTTYSSSRAAHVAFSTDTRFGVVFTPAGYDNYILGVVQVSTESTIGTSTDSTSTFAAGYTLSDSDAGDYFSVDTARDPRYGTYVFNTVSGASSNPWEPGTQKRDNPRLAIDPPVRDGVLGGQPAMFTLSLTNASESNERREYILDAPPHLNPRGASIRYQGDYLNERRVLVEAGQTISFPITVERGPEETEYDLAIIAYSPFDHAIWRTAPQLGLVTIDTTRFQVRFIPLVAPVRLVEPLDGWAVTAAAPSVQLTLGDLALEGTVQETVGVEFRRIGEPWQTAISVTGDQVTGTSHAAVWTPAAALADGAYELRAFARRSGAAAPPPFAGPARPGWVDRTRPVVFGLPTPASGVLALGETIGLTFEEPVDCPRLRRDLLAGLTLAELVSGAGTSAALSIGCAEQTVLLAPADVSTWAVLEGQLATARVRGVRDLQGNPMVPLAGADAGWDASWRFTVRRNAFGWTPALVTVRAQPGIPADLPAALVNGRAQPVDYTLVAQNATGLPFRFTETTTGAEVRATTTPLAGTVVAGDVQPVAFRWPGAPVGTYRSVVEVESREAGALLGRSSLAMTVEVACAAPLWAVNPAAFEASMTVMAELRMAGAASEDPADLLAAFVDGEVRGVAPVQLLTASGATVGRVPLTVYGPGGAERVVFQAWDASACTRHLTTSQLLEFAGGASVGTVAAPLVVVAPGPAEGPLEVPLAAGWTWVSTHRAGTETLASALVGVGSSGTDLIQSQDAFSQYVPGSGWFGGVAGILPGEGYAVRLAQPATMTHPGARVDPTLPLALTAGWNWTGYLPAVPLPLADALAGGAFETDDVVKSQTAYAQFVAGTGWFGSLAQMRPGLGYQFSVQSDLVLTYPAGGARGVADPLRARPVRRMDRLPVPAEVQRYAVAVPPEPAAAGPSDRAAVGRSAQKGAPGGDVGYEHSMILTATIETDSDSLWVAAFVPDGDGEALRGLAPVEAVEALGGRRAFLLVAGTAADSVVTLRAGYVDADGAFVPSAEGLLFAAGVPGGGDTAPAPAVLRYERDRVWGTPTAPVALAWQGATSGAPEPLPAVVDLAPARPNPLSASAVFGYALPAASEVRLVVYDVLGRAVAVLVDGERPAGRHEARFDARTLASGTYVARLVVGGEVRVRRFTVAR